MRLTKKNREMLNIIKAYTKKGGNFPITGTQIDHFAKANGIPFSWCSSYGGIHLTKLWKLGILVCVDPDENCRRYSLPNAVEIAKMKIERKELHPALKELLECF